MKKLLIALLVGIFTLSAAAQETVYQIEDITAINYGDGRLLFRKSKEDKAPLNGQHRIIDGYRSEYRIANFKDGMYSGSYQHFKSNKLKEEGEYKEGRKHGVYKEYASDGKMLKTETPYTDGKMDGIVKNYSTEGKLEKEKEYKMGIENGIERKYDYKTGDKVIDRNYKDGKLNGKETALIASSQGEYIREATYENGVAIGKTSEMYLDGTIKMLGTYDSKGKKDGDWIVRTHFNAAKITTYRNGEVVKEDKIKDLKEYQQNL